MNEIFLKTCSSCQHDKPKTEFNKAKHRKDGLQTSCKECSRARSKRYYSERTEYHKKQTTARATKQRLRNLQFTYDYLSKNPCVDCGHTTVACLEFDHVRGRKLKPVSHMVGEGYSIKSIEKEIAKCEVRCANCHRIKTADEQGWYGKLFIQSKKETTNEL